MATSNPETIEIKESIVMDGRKKLKRYELYIDTCRRAVIEQKKNGSVMFRFDPTGLFHYSEARIWLQGLMELAMVAEGLQNDK